MRKITKKTLTIIVLTICFIINTCLGDDCNGMYWYWPDCNWWEQWSLLWWPRNNWMSLQNTPIIYNTDITQAIDTKYNWTDIEENPIEVWMWSVIWAWWNEQIWGLAWTETEITDYHDALNKILKVIQNVVNYTLWILWLIALIYLIIHGIIILTALSDDSRTKKWLKWVKTAFIAIAWIWLSWVMISFILWLINKIAW